MFDVIIIGGGPAGLSAALVLARCRRTLLLCDAVPMLVVVKAFCDRIEDLKPIGELLGE